MPLWQKIVSYIRAPSEGNYAVTFKISLESKSYYQKQQPKSGTAALTI